MALMEQTELLPQHLTALARANRVRLERAETRRRVGARELTLEAALELPEVQGATIAAVIKWLPRWGDVRTRKFLATFPMSEEKKVGTMTERQKRAVVLELMTGAQRKAAVAEAEATRARQERPLTEPVGWRSARTVSNTHLRLPALTFTLCGVEVPVDLELAVASGPLCLNCKRIDANH